MALDTDAAVGIVTERFTAGREQLEIPGMAYALIRHGAIVHDGGIGECEIGSGQVPTADSVFRIASMTKSFTASAVLLLRDRGLLRLDDPVEAHCPWVAGVGAPRGSWPITIRDLMVMQAGFPTDDPWGDRQESLPLDQFDALVAGGLSFTRAPRTRFEYSNLSYALLGRVISSATGRDYRAVIREELLMPLSMHSTSFIPQETAGRLVQGYAPTAEGPRAQPLDAPGAFSAMGGLLSTVRDLAVWVGGFQDAQAASSLDHPLAAASRREMQQPQTAIETAVTAQADGNPLISTLSYGMGLLIDDVHGLGRFVCHGGGYPGFGSHMRWHVGSGWALVALGNRTYANLTRLCAEVLRELVTAEDALPVPDLWPETVEAMSVVESLAGEWNDDVADTIVSMNVDLDQSRAERAAQWRSLRERLGPLHRTSDPVQSHSAAHARWWVEGTGGRAVIEIRLSPERPPRVQTLTFAPEEPADR